MNERELAERQNFLNKFGTLKFTRFDPEIAAGKLGKSWSCLPYKINIMCNYIKPLYELYERKVSPGLYPITDAQRFDFECIVISNAKKCISPNEKIEAARREIERISAENGDYIPYSFAPQCLFPVRAFGTIYQGSLKSIDIEPYKHDNYYNVRKKHNGAGAAAD